MAQGSFNSLTSATPRRQLGLASAIAAVAGETIAVGIFLTPAGMAKSLGSPFYLLLIWVVVGILTVCGALTYGELAARFPRDGGVYVFLEESYGRGTAFLYGWMCLLVLDPGLTAALAVGLASYFGYIVSISSIGAKFVAIAVIWLLCVLNVLSIRVSAGVLRWSTWLKLGLLAVLVVWGFSLRVGSWSNFVPFVDQRHGSPPLLPALGAAMVGAFFSFGGWWDVSKISGEIRDPGRTLPRAMLFGTLAVTAVYILVSAVFLYLVPLSGVTSNETFVAQAGSVLFGSLGGKIFAAIVIVCVFSSLAALIMSAPRVYYAMAQDGLFFKRVSQISPRFGTPVSAILIQGTISSLLVAVSSFQKIIEYFIFVAVWFLAMAGAGLFLARRKNSGTNPAFRTPWYPLPVIIFLLLILTLLVLLAGHGPLEAGLGGAVVLAGIPAYLLFRSGGHHDGVAQTQIPEQA
ncbi:MAG TPA: amino acid permease [Terriglobales bacterium]|nr:amino acid permease [Terriglobales bacterium]